jgi:hypothetical protein
MVKLLLAGTPTSDDIGGWCARLKSAVAGKLELIEGPDAGKVPAARGSQTLEETLEGPGNWLRTCLIAIEGADVIIAEVSDPSAEAVVEGPPYPSRRALALPSHELLHQV